jgi:hypothetical protein
MRDSISVRLTNDHQAELIATERDFLHDLLRDGKITDESRRRLERDLDLEEATILARREGETPAVTAPSDHFYASLPLFRRLHRGDGPEAVQPAAGDWVVGTADVVQSTKAIAENRYKGREHGGRRGDRGGNQRA